MLPDMRRRQPRVLMTTDAVGGVWTYAVELASGLAAAGAQTTLVVLGPAPTPHQRAEARRVPALHLVETGLALDWTASDVDQLRGAAATLEELCRAGQPDILHLNSPALAGLARYDVPVIGVCHSCLATWWAAAGRGPMPAEFVWRSAVLRRGLLACDLLVAPSAAFAAATARAHQVAPPLVVANGRRPAAAGSRQRRRCVFSAGRLWDPGKDVATLDAAAAHVDADIYVAGPLAGPAGQRVELRQAIALGSLGCEDVRRWLARVPVFASMARYEPFGLAVLEAAQAGCALVLSDIPTFRELWDGAALFVRPGQAGALAATLQSLLDDPERTAHLGIAARQRAARYTAAAMVAGMLDLYGRLAPGFRPMALLAGRAA